ncbi:hypothetical protein PG994_011011 [Apiospora phragmitis]|uniref:Sulfotransferase n=1 Tax=Apiospora phragmitis TaxID=2905665 RepID=A0ABR1TTV3_9PEZI
MKVIVLGLPRTGTQCRLSTPLLPHLETTSIITREPVTDIGSPLSALAEALIHLGISPVYHVREVGKNQHTPLRTEAIGAMFEVDSPWGREEFDKILDEYEGLADYPAAIFPEELIEAYPEAAVILTVRDDGQKWHDSMMSTLIPAHAQHNHRSSQMYLLADKYHQHCWSNEFSQHGLALYRRHNKAVRDAASRRGRKLLEYGPGLGWAPLCEFLGFPIPTTDVPYPRADDWLGYN